MARINNQINGLVNQPAKTEDWQDTSPTNSSKKPAKLMKATDFLNGATNFKSSKVEDLADLQLDGNPQAEDDADYHVRAGRIGGQTTKQRHRDSNFYKEIGARGGTTTMARHGSDYAERRKKGGDTTRERYGEEYYHNIAAKAARSKQDATRLRNDAIKALMSIGIKIPTIIKLTLDDLMAEPRVQPLLKNGPLAEYLQERPDSENPNVFLSQSGKPLSLANTYTVMERHKSGDEI